MTSLSTRNLVLDLTQNCLMPPQMDTRPFPRYDVVVGTKKNGDPKFLFYRRSLGYSEKKRTLVQVTTAIPRRDVPGLEARGVRFTEIPAKPPKPYTVPDGGGGRSTSPFFIDSYIRHRGSDKSFHGKKKQVQTISTSQVKWLAKTHNVSPEVTKSIIQHADQLILKEIDTYKGFSRQVTRPKTEHVPPRLVAKNELSDKIRIMRRFGIPYPVDIAEDLPVVSHPVKASPLRKTSPPVSGTITRVRSPFEGMVHVTHSPPSRSRVPVQDEEVYTDIYDDTYVGFPGLPIVSAPHSLE